MAWLGNTLQDIGSTLGSGVMSLLSWLFSGLLSVATKILVALGGVYDLLDAIIDFFIGVKDSILGLLPVLFPFVPEDVMLVISFGLYFIYGVGGEASIYPTEDIQRLAKTKVKEWKENH